MSQFDERGLPPGMQIRPEFELTPAAVKAILSDPRRAKEIMLLDVRLEEERAFARIDPSSHGALHDLENRAAEVIDEAEGRMIVTYCHRGVRSLKAALLLRHFGATNAMSLAGGIDLWSLAVDPSVRRYERDGTVVRAV